MKNTYSDKLKSPKWQKKRLEILSRDKFTCKLCKDTETQLHVHHKYYEDGCDPWEYPNTALVTLCADCHKEIERIKDKDGFDFDKVKIIKQNNWTDDSIVIWVLFNDRVILRIYDSEGVYIEGYNITTELRELSSLFRKAYNGK